jgi:hypothetical protein
MGVHLETVNVALHELELSGRISIRGSGAAVLPPAFFGIRAEATRQHRRGY